MRFSKDKHISALKLLYENELGPNECIEILGAIEDFERYEEDSDEYNNLEDYLFSRFIPHDIFNMSCRYDTDILPIKATHDYQYCLRDGTRLIPYLSLL